MRAAVRPIDTSTLGPIRLEPRQTSRARELFAQRVEALGPGYHNAANSIRAGWENVWIAAGIAALEVVLRQLPEDDA